jgi:hypothetical protein
MLIVIPCGGMGNRLMALVSARVLAEHLGCSLQVCWQPPVWLGDCPVSMLFPDIESLPLPAPGSGFVHYHHREGPVPELEARLCAGEAVVLHSYCFIFPQGMPQGEFTDRLRRKFAQLRPHPEALARVPALPENVVGVHVRQKDHWRAQRYSPLALFLRVMNGLCERQPDVHFFLATDSGSTRAFLRRRYGARLTTLDPPRSGASVDLARAALVDMLALTRTRAIYHSYMSSFSYIAHLMSGRPHHPVCRPNAPAGWHDAATDLMHDRFVAWDTAAGQWRMRLERGGSWRHRAAAAGFMGWTQWVCSPAYQRWPFHRMRTLAAGP